MTPNGHVVMPPITYPTFEIRGIVYIIKLARNSTYRLEHYGMGDWAATAKKLNELGRNIQLTYKMAACMLGRETRGGFWKPISIPDVELDELPEVLAAETMDRFAELVEKLQEALPKVPAVEVAQTPRENEPTKQNESGKTDGSMNGPSEPARTDSDWPVINSGA